MNPLALLSLQLVLYGATWLVLGLVFGVRRESCFWWAAAFLLLAVGCGVLEQGGSSHVAGALLPFVSAMAVGGFYALMRGLAHMGRYPLSRWDTLVPLGMLVVLVLLRATQTEWIVVRLALFSVAVGWTLLRSAWLLQRLLSDAGYGRLFLPLGLFPVLAIVVLISLRPLAVLWLPENAAEYLLLADSSFMNLFVVTGFVVLMLFNLAMAVVVVGGLVRHLRNLSLTDALTQLANRRSLVPVLEREHSLFLRTRKAYSLLVLDLDHFKHINDTHGHAVGDEVLRRVAATLQGCLRVSDMAARVGGEEFTVLLPGSEATQAAEVAERIRLQIMNAPVPVGALRVSVTISIGVATATPADALSRDVLARADQALYRAKHLGRNRVELAT